MSDQSEPIAQLRAACCVVGGGPAGLLAGFLLARAGVDVIVLERHPDFLRDFRGDTIHPSTLQVLDELGLLEDLLKLPHGEAHRLAGRFGEKVFVLADFSKLKAKCPFLIFMPQWDLLNFLAERARKLRTFRLMMSTPATGLIEEHGTIAGVAAASDAGPLEIRCDLVIAADGRHSTVRSASGLRSREIGAPMDVLWFKLSRDPSDDQEPAFRFAQGRMFIMLNRGDHWQCGYIIAKGGFAAIRVQGIEAFRSMIGIFDPKLTDRLFEIRSFEDVSLLSVAVNRLPIWHRQGLLAIGDAAHAMSPVGGVGINLAIQDAVAAANLLWKPLTNRDLSEKHLRDLQRRRAWPVMLTQAFQVAVQKRVIGRFLSGGVDATNVPVTLRVMQAAPILKRAFASFIAFGARLEHVSCPDASPPA